MTREEWFSQRDIYTGVTLREAIERHLPFTRYAASNPAAKAAIKRRQGGARGNSRQNFIDKQIEEMRKTANEKIW